MPTQARRISVKKAITTVHARELLKEAGVKQTTLVASIGRDIAAFGSDIDLLRAFSMLDAQIMGTVELHPDTDSWACGLIYDALTKAVCRNKPLLPRLRRKGHSVIVAGELPTDNKEKIAWRNKHLSSLENSYSTALCGKVPTSDYPFNEGIRLRLDQAMGSWWCVFEPFTHVELPRSNNAPENKTNPTEDWQRERWARRYNRVWAKILSAWAKILAGENDGTIHTFGLPESDGIDAMFQLSPITAWSRPSHKHDYFLRGGR
jgi:predicted nucleotidyltransferase